MLARRPPWAFLTTASKGLKLDNISMILMEVFINNSCKMSENGSRRSRSSATGGCPRGAPKAELIPASLELAADSSHSR